MMVKVADVKLRISQGHEALQSETPFKLTGSWLGGRLGMVMAAGQGPAGGSLLSLDHPSLLGRQELQSVCSTFER